MLGKILGLVVAGVFIGAAVVEIVNLTRGERNGKKPLPGETPDEDSQPGQKCDLTSVQTQG